MIKYILVDDDQSTLEYVKSKIDSISKIYQLDHVASYDNSKKAFEEVSGIDYDLLIVDYEMPVFNGVELAQHIAKTKHVIFLTSTVSNEQKIINSVNIVGYLSKPFDIHEFSSIVKNKIIGKTKEVDNPKENDYINIQIGANKDIQFSPKLVYYFTTSKNFNGEKPDKNHLNIYGKYDELLFENIRITINKLNEKLRDHSFEKINQSTIINMDHIKERDNTNIGLFYCKETFEITATNKSGFVSKLRRKLGI